KWVTVQSISREQAEKQIVYNIGVDEDMSYVANGVAVHNCRCAAVEIFVGESTARADRIREPEPKEIGGVLVMPTADKGFGFNPGMLFRPPPPRQSGSIAASRA